MRLTRNNQPIGEQVICGELVGIRETPQDWIFKVDTDGVHRSVSVAKRHTSVTVTSRGMTIEERNRNA